MAGFEASRLHESIAAVCPIIGIQVGNVDDRSTWTIQFDPSATAQQRTNAQAVINAFDPSITSIPLDLIQARMETEGVWDTYVNFAFGNATRRNVFLKVMFVGKPIRQDNATFKSSMTNAGISQAAQDRILATP